MEIIKRIEDKFHSLVMQSKDFKTKRRIVVFESDDWGSIRMSNKNDWGELLKLGYAVDKRPYERFDTLESAEDIEYLLNVLYKHKDSNGSHPVLTMNMLMANPDFMSMDKDNYNYSYETISETYRHYWGNTRVLELMKEGFEHGIIMPQSHGREHFNVKDWERLLKRYDKDIITAFNYHMCGIAPKEHPELGNTMMKAFFASNEVDQCVINDIVEEGLKMFKHFWGFHSKTFVAPCYVWNDNIEKILSDNGVKLIQTARRKKATYNSPEAFMYSGQKNKYSQVYSIRNCEFEPATYKGNAVDTCLSQITKAFNNSNIAVVSTHRINYVSGISKNNRNETLRKLDELLSEINKRFPTVEYLSSDKLIDVLLKETA